MQASIFYTVYETCATQRVLQNQ